MCAAYTRCFLLEYKRILRLKCDGIRAETKFRLSVKLRSPFKFNGMRHNLINKCVNRLMERDENEINKWGL